MFLYPWTEKFFAFVSGILLHKWETVPPGYISSEVERNQLLGTHAGVNPTPL